MRFLIATGLFVVSLALLLVGLGQRTIWAAPTETHLTLRGTTSVPFVVIPNSTLNAHAGAVSLNVAAPGRIFAATGRTTDIQAWLGRERHSTLNFEAKTFRVIENLSGAVASKVNPAGSDLWRFEATGSKSLKVPLSRGSDNAVLLASDGVHAAPSAVDLVWRINRDVSQSTILLILGGVIMIVAFVFNSLALAKNRGRRGPRRRLPKPPQGPKYKAKRSRSAVPPRGRHRSSRGGRALGAVVASTLAVGALTGCATGQQAKSPSPSPSSSASVQTAPPAVSAKQLDRILAKVVAVTTAADSREDKKTLKIRFAGPALALRAINYKLRKLSSRTTPSPGIAESPVTFVLPQATTSWPRKVMVVTEDKASHSLPQLLVLVQKSPRENYKVWYAIPLLPGATIPAVPLAGVGSIAIPADSLFLKLKPAILAFAFGDVINKGDSSQFASKFAVGSNSFFTQMSQNQAQVKASLKSATARFEHALGDQNVESLATTDGGALVAVYMLDNYIIRAKKRTSAVTVSGQEKLLLKASGSTTGIKATYGNMLLFYIPPSSAQGGIQLLGANQGLLAVKNL